jgi:hypothetical protein
MRMTEMNIRFYDAGARRAGVFLAFTLLVMGLVGCAQDSIFDDISHEVPPRDPLIKGGPSKIVEANNKLYVTNGSIFEYNGSSWSRSNGPGGYVTDIAASTKNGGTLYAMTLSGASSAVYKKSNSGWVPVGNTSAYDFIQCIFGAGDVLFAGSAKRSGDGYGYAILYDDDDGNGLRLLKTTTGLLSGAGTIDGAYYLATMGDGIIKAEPFGGGSPPSTIGTLPNAPPLVAGLIQAQDNLIIAAGRNGAIIIINNSHSDGVLFSYGSSFTGALAFWQTVAMEAEHQALILVGIKGGSTSYNHGYQELLFDTEGTSISGSLRDPGKEQPSSVDDNPKYNSTLRRFPVNALWVLNGTETESPPLIMFAATRKDGLRSYRPRSGDWQWNAED